MAATYTTSGSFSTCCGIMIAIMWKLTAVNQTSDREQKRSKSKDERDGHADQRNILEEARWGHRLLCWLFRYIYSGKKQNVKVWNAATQTHAGEKKLLVSLIWKLKTTLMVKRQTWAAKHRPATLFYNCPSWLNSILPSTWLCLQGCSSLLPPATPAWLKL